MKQEVPKSQREGQGLSGPDFVALLVVLAVATLSVPTVAADSPQPGARDRCPVCGMFVAPHPTWVAVVAYDDGSHDFFDGPKDMFRFLLDPSRYRRAGDRRAVTAIWVKDYYTTRPLDARTAHFVLGSDVMGPMGRELVPTASAQAAQTLLSDHRGEKALSFDQVTAAELP